MGYLSDCIGDADDKNDDDDPECNGISNDLVSGVTGSAASSLDGCTMVVVTFSSLERCNPPMVSKTALPQLTTS